MRQFLIKTSTNWADEIDLEGFIILDEKELEDATKETPKDLVKVETGFDS